MAFRHAEVPAGTTVWWNGHPVDVVAQHGDKFFVFKDNGPAAKERYSYHYVKVTDVTLKDPNDHRP